MIDIENLSPAELDDLLARAALRRAQLEPPVPMERPHAKIEITVNPAWSTQSMELGALLQFRHLGLGWLSFALAPADRIQLALALLHQALLAGPPAPPAQLVQATGVKSVH